MAQKQTSRQKGTELEVEFAEFMKKELGYKETWLNDKVKGKTSTNEYEVDIVGRKMSEKGIQQRSWGTWIFVIGILISSCFLLELIDIDADMFLVIGGITVVGGIIIGIGNQNMYEYTWVECKNHKSKIGKGVLIDLGGKIDDYHESQDRERDFTEAILVSGSGFIINALRFADKHNVTCYEKTGKGQFKIVSSNKIE